MTCELLPKLKTWSTKERELNTLRLHIDILTICRNKCSYCYSRADAHNWGKFMSKEYIENTLFPNIRNLANYLHTKNKFLDVVLLGGEPTLHPMFQDIIEYVLSFPNTRMSITTNGSNGYANVRPHKNLRWGISFHPSQVKNEDAWIEKIIERKNDFWEVTIHPFSDCWGDDKTLELYSHKNKKIIDVCIAEGIKLQPVFQYDPHTHIRDHRVDIDKLIKFYPYLNDLEALYSYNNTLINDYQMIISKKNCFENWYCVNNSISIDVNGNLQQCCSYKALTWEDLYTYDCSEFRCPLPVCTCIGFLSLYKNE